MEAITEPTANDARLGARRRLGVKLRQKLTVSGRHRHAPREDRGSAPSSHEEMSRPGSVKSSCSIRAANGVPTRSMLCFP